MNEKKLFDQLVKENSIDGKLIYLGQLLQRAAHNHPNKIALVCEDQSVTFANLCEQSATISQWLTSQGIKPRDRVLLYVYNSIDFYALYYAILQIGAIVAPLNVFLKERELEHIISDAQPKLIIASEDLVDRVHKIGTNVPITTPAAIKTASASYSSADFKLFMLDEHEMAVLLYTSGTTGLPKGVMISSYNAVINTIQGIIRFNPLPNDRVLAALPLFHSFAQNTYVWTPIFIGIMVVIVPKIERRYILQALQLHSPTIFAAVPAFYGLLCLLKTAPLNSGRIFVSGGDALPDKIRAAFELLYRRKLVNGYGMTEMSPFVAASFEDEAVVNTCVGKPLVHIEYSIRDDQGKELPQGSVGQLWLKGPNVMLGYYKEPTMTSEVIKDGWLSTGDLAYIDEKERFVITGRYKDLIKHKGFNIYPQEVENVLLLYPNVLRAAVIGVPDAEFGEIAVAYVQLKENERGVEENLKDVCIKNLADYKVPKKFICSTQELPLTTTGKVDKKALRSKYEKD